MSIKRSILLTLILGGMIFLGFYYVQSQKKTPALVVERTKGLTVTTINPVVEEWPKLVKASGAIAPWQLASVSSQFDVGHVQSVKVDVGDYVSAGQTLALFDTQDLEIARKKLLANLYKAKSLAEQAKSDLAADRLLSKKNLISEQKLNNSKTQYKTYLADAKAIMADLASNDLQKQYASLKASADGFITKRNIQMGMVVSKGFEAFQMIRQGRLEWQAEVSAEQIELIKVGQKVIINNGTKINGIVRRISPLANDNRLFIVFISIPDDQPVHAGMYLDGQIIVRQEKVLTVPLSSILVNDGKSYVFTVTESDHHFQAHRLAVTPIMYRDNKVAIEGTLSSKSQIINEGVGFLNDGDDINLKHEQIASDSSAFKGDASL